MANVGQEIVKALEQKGQSEGASDLTLRDKAQALESLERITKELFSLPPEDLTLAKLRELRMVAEIGWADDLEIQRSEAESEGRIKTLHITPYRYWLVIRPSAISYESLWEGFESVGRASIPELAESLSQ
jgi:hypothetical protein